MPELPEVQTIVNALRPRLLGKTIARANLVRPDILTPRDFDFPAAVMDRSIADLHRRGKRIVFTLDDGQRFYIHLGMTGRLGLAPASEAMKKHTHLVVIFEEAANEMQLRFADPRRFGGVWWLADQDPAGDMGPEPMQLRPGQLASRMAPTTRPVKSALLDQTVVAGLGNIYVDESLFAARIHPQSPAGALSAAQIQRLNRAIKSVLRKAIHHRGSTLRDYRDADGVPGDFQSLHRVYGRQGQPCPTCGRPIRRIVLTGRSTHFCPRCQPRG